MIEQETGAAEGWEPQFSAVLAPMDERTLVADLTRVALVAAAPEELDVFVANEDRYLDGLRGDTSDESDEMLGFGLETVGLLTPYVVAAATVAVRLIAEALAQSAAAEAKPLLVRWMHQLFHREPKRANDLPTLLPADLVHRVRAVTYRVLKEDLRLAEGDAALVSDAIAGRLATSPS